MKYFFEDQTTNASSDSLYIANSLLQGKYITVFARGTWDSATVTTEISDNGEDWWEAGTNTTFTASDAGNIYCNYGFYIRATISGAGAGTELTVGIQ
jgi:N-glycosylase/DNA lyase